MVKKLSQVSINLIKKFEGCRLKAYKCPAGIWTIGYGSTSGVKEGQVITQQQADALLEKDLQRFVDGVNKLVTVDLNQNQFDALVSFAYNCGIGALQKSTLLQLVNKKDFANAAKEFDKWVKVDGKVLKGLQNRRNEEQVLFLKEMKDVVKQQVVSSFQKAQTWVKENGISDGSRPKDPVTREEVWEMIKRYHENMSK
jgi:lysozyme